MSEEKKELSVITDLATSHGMSREQFEAALKATVFPDKGTPAQFAAFCMVAKQYDLNPLLKEIYAFPSKSGGIIPIVSVDGWCNIINSNAALDGIQFDDKFEDGKLVAITCKISRKDRKHPVECTEYMSECKRDVDTWKKWPARMLRHKALIQCARYAFSLSGIYDEDEAQRMDMIDVTPKKKKAFSRREERSQWLAKTMLRFEEAKTIEEVEAINAEIQPTMDLLFGDSGENGMTWAKADASYMQAVSRLSLSDDEAERLEQMQEQLRERE